MPLLSLSKNFNIIINSIIIAGFFFLIPSEFFAAADSCIVKDNDASVKNLSWISGYWVDDPDQIKTEELWLEPSAGLMLGLHRDILEGNKYFFEYLRIEELEGEIIFFASPRGKKAVGFKLTDHDDFLVVFENHENEFPKRIIYQLVDEKLHVKIDGGAQNTSKSLSWIWQKID